MSWTPPKARLNCHTVLLFRKKKSFSQGEGVDTYVRPLTFPFIFLLPDDHQLFILKAWFVSESLNSSLYIVGKAVKNTQGHSDSSRAGVILHVAERTAYLKLELCFDFQGLGAREREAAPSSLCAVLLFLFSCVLERAVTKTVMLGRCKSSCHWQLMALWMCL